MAIFLEEFLLKRWLTINVEFKKAGIYKTLKL